jgi:hypothetical protein
LTKNNNKNVTSVPTVDSILESFPTNPLTKIHGRPTYDSLNELRNELKSNASSIPTSRGGGGHGYLGLILSADDYNNAVGQPFNLLCTTASAEPSCRCHSRPNRRSQPPARENVREWREYNNIQAALRKQLLNAVEDVYVSAIKSPLTGYNNLSVHDILKHLFTSYGKIPPSRASQNALRIYTNLGMPTRLLNT